MIVFGKSGFNSCKGGCIWAKVVVFGQNSCIRAKWLYSGQKWLYSGKVVVFGQKWLYSGKSGCNRAKVVVFI